jgi:AraC-like DNA-binding protein
MTQRAAEPNGQFFAGLAFTTPPQFFYWDRNYHWRPPPLPDFDLWCIMSGRGTVRLRNKVHELQPGSCFVLRPGDSPDAHHDPDYPLAAFFCHFSFLDRRGRRIRPPASRLPPPAVQAHDIGMLASLARRCVAVFRRGDALGRRQSLVLLEDMLLLVYEWAFLPPPSAVDARIRDIMQAVECRPGQPWDIGTMSRDAHLSRSQFSRRFRELAGAPPIGFVIRARLNLARQLVVETNMKLAHIAAELGYSDVYFFSRQFKQRFGVPPSVLRPKGRSPPR